MIMQITMLAMIKLSASSSALGLALGAAATAAGTSHFQSPAALHHLHVHSVQRKLLDARPPQPNPNRRRSASSDRGGRVEDPQQQPPSRRARRAAVDYDAQDCPGSPFLWKIVDDSTGEHVGFGVGTMHLPLDLVTSPGARRSIEAAIGDSCDVYGELNLVSSDVTSSLEACGLPLEESSARVADIPDAELRAAIEAKILEIATLVDELSADAEDESTDPDPEVAALYASRLLDLPLPEVQRIILYGNTPEYREKYAHTILSGAGAGPMDAHLLALGRPANDLEEVSTHCEILERSHPTKDDLDLYYERYSDSIRNSLDASLTREIDMYECGDVDAFAAEVAAGMAVDGDSNDDILSERNAQMASGMIDVLRAGDDDDDERVMFALGVAHWITGAKSLRTLLKEGGYSLVHLPGWDEEDAEDHSNERCKVMFDTELEGGWFAPAPSPALTTAGGDGVTREPTHSVIKPTYFTEEDNSTDFELTLETIDEDGEEKPAKPRVKDTSSSSAAIGVSKMVIAAGLVQLLGYI